MEFTKLPILRTKNLSISFGGTQAVSNCFLMVEQNSITGLIGPNGAGKTTLFDVISGLLRQDEGEIYFRQQRIDHLPIYKRSRLGISRTFQSIRLFPELRVIDNIIVTLKGHKEKVWQSLFFSKKQRKELEKEAIEILKIAGLEHKAFSFTQSLSYGQQKLLEILRAFSYESELLLLDEPAAGVNPTMLKRIVELIKKLHQQGKTILLVEHNMNFVMNLCQKVIVMDYGKEIAAGTPAEIQNNPKVLEAYLGKKRLANNSFPGSLKQ